MVAFGKKLKEKALPEWQSYYISYKAMKKKIKEYSRCNLPNDQNHSDALKEFSRILDTQIEKIVLFILEQQGLLASKLEQLGEKSLALQQQIDAPGVAELREAYRDVGHDLLKLLDFVELNAVGIRKILKKFDKRCGYKLTNYYVSTRANHPYSQLQQVFKHVGIGAVLGTLTRNLVGLQDSQGSWLSIYDQPSSHSLKEPVIDSIRAAMDRLTHSTNFLHFLGQHALIILDDLPTPTSELVEETYHFTSLLLNLANTFLYMVNTYIIVPTADDYAVNLGAAATVCGIIIGSMAVAQVFSSVYFSAWSNKSYFRPLVFSSIFLLVGNILYALAYDANSIVVLLVGRLLCGLGSARAVNRRYISDCVPIRIRMQASAGFVSASALGMACGPALAGILGANFKIYKLTFDETTLPGWLMALAWIIYLILLWFLFEEPHHLPEENDLSHENIHARTDNDKLEKGLGKPLLMNSSDVQEAEGPPDCEGSDTSVEEPQPASTIASAYRLLTPPVKVQLLIYFMLKYAMEILLSESSIITSHYFSWSTSSVAIFLACLGLTVLPVNAIVGTYISNLFQERQILLASEIMVFVGILGSFHFIGTYSPAQYICSAFITFVFAEVLEGVNLSLLSQVMSSRLARGTYNGGLLSTEAGTLARVVADGTITLAGYLWKKHLLNITLLPSLLICVASIGATFYTYNSLF